MKPTDLQLRQLLLRRLATEEAMVLEDAILMEDGVAEQLSAAEFDLLDDYARGQLDPEDRARVEGYLLTSDERLFSLRVTRAMDAHGAALPSPAPHGSQPDPRHRRRGWPQLIAAGCLAASVGAILWIAVRPDAPHTATATRPRPAPREPWQVVTLLEDRPRSGATSPLRLTVQTPVVRLQLEVPGRSSEAYALDIRDDVGRITYHVSSLPWRETGPYGFVETTVPAPALGPGFRTLVLRHASGEPGQVAYSWRIDGLLTAEAQKKPASPP